jgi:hypothetical protein
LPMDSFPIKMKNEVRVIVPLKGKISKAEIFC